MRFLLFCCLYFTFIVSLNAAVLVSDDVDEQGLYSKSDNLIILTNENFDRKVYGQKHALLVQFYNSFCGHCRQFAPKFKTLAKDIVAWKNVFQLAVLDCSVEANSNICRNFEVMAYPTLRYLHEQYSKGNNNVGDIITLTETVDQLREQLVHKLQAEQNNGRLNMAPSLSIASYNTYEAALQGVPVIVDYTFLIFESVNSTVGSELILDTNDYKHIRVKRANENSEILVKAGVKQVPYLVVLKNTQEPKVLTPQNPNRKQLLKSIKLFLSSKMYEFPDRGEDLLEISKENFNSEFPNDDTVYYSDLEKTLQNILHVEITRYKTLNGKALNALNEFMEVLVKNFPFKTIDSKDYFSTLANAISHKTEWKGVDLLDKVKDLEEQYKPYITNLEYFGCHGSQPQFRGYTCGLWTLFHTLTVNAAHQTGLEGPKVLKAIYGYVKYFFGCTECSEHFKAMADRNRIFDVKENDKAVLWLWISHNEVNLRLAGDVTEDPKHRKIQFPSPKQCPVCRLSRGAWNLPAVYQYLQHIYGSTALRTEVKNAAYSLPSPFSSLDIGMLSLL